MYVSNYLSIYLGELVRVIVRGASIVYVWVYVGIDLMMIVMIV